MSRIHFESLLEEKYTKSALVSQGLGHVSLLSQAGKRSWEPGLGVGEREQELHQPLSSELQAKI